MVDLWPLRIKLGGVYDLKDQNFNATAECHDAVLGGEVSFDVLHKSVEYSKLFDLGEGVMARTHRHCEMHGPLFLLLRMTGMFYASTLFSVSLTVCKHTTPTLSLRAGGVSQLALRGRCDMGEGRDRWDASFGFVIEPKVSTSRTGVSTHVANTTNGFDIMAEVPLSKVVSAEVCGHLTLPLPTAEFMAHTRGGGGGRLTVGRHGNVTAHVAQINAVVTL